jgi:hypothetical protein
MEPCMVFADVIFITFADLMGFFMIPIVIAVVCMEGGVIWLFNQTSLWKDCLFCSIVMNFISAIFGLFLPSKLGAKSLLLMLNSSGVRYEEFGNYGSISVWIRVFGIFLLAWFLSMLIELVPIYLFRKVFGLNRVAFPILIGNTLSYLFLLYCYCVFVRC